MAKINRADANVQPFAINSVDYAGGGAQRYAFGNPASVTFDLTTYQTAEYLTGYARTNQADVLIPTQQEFNGALAKATGENAYLHQMGVTEWNTNQEYFIGSIANIGGELYKSTIDNNVGNDPTAANGFGQSWDLLRRDLLAWSASTTYTTDDIVSYLGKLYKGLTTPNTGNTPSTSPTEWSLDTGHEVSNKEAVLAGTIAYFPTSTAPSANWAIANGVQLTTAGFPDLFGRIGYTYGGGGALFGTPDIRGRVIRPWSDGSGHTGFAGGIGTVYTDETYLPNHDHGYRDTQYVNGNGQEIHNVTNYPFFTTTQGIGSDADANAFNDRHWYIDHTTGNAGSTGEVNIRSIIMMAMIKLNDE